VSRAAFAIACAGAVALVASRAWIADDAFITFRVIENLCAGHGLRWNVDERVQVFTHPLWALLQVPVYLLVGSLPVASFLLGLACSVLAGTLAWRAAQPGRATFLLAFVVPLAAARAVADHAVSGLESPLVAVCLAAFAACALPARASTPWLVLSLVAGLAATTRLDALVLLLPCLVALSVRARGRLPWSKVALGFLPLVSWELFACLYYGFPFPNTKYAKLDTGIAAGDLARQGVNYALDLLRRDTGSALILGSGLAFAARRLPGAVAALREGRAAETGAEPLSFAAIGLGVAAYAGFVVRVGGDFMSGRFFAPAVFLAAVLVARALRESPRRAAGFAAIVVGASLASAAARPADPNATWYGIADERAVFVGTTSVLWTPGLRDGAPMRHPWWRDGARARERARGERVVLVRGAVGMMGFAAGPDVTVIDSFALGDALLARLPVVNAKSWRIGHFERALPAGYLHARETGDTSRMYPELARGWEELRFVTSGPLLDPERLAAILHLNTSGPAELRAAAARSAAAVGPTARRRPRVPTGR
jgi:arabinofuranosyltransferase